MTSWRDLPDGNIRIISPGRFLNAATLYSWTSQTADVGIGANAGVMKWKDPEQVPWRDRLAGRDTQRGHRGCF